MMPEAKPTTRAADRMSRAPAMSSSAILLAEKPAMTPHTMPIPRNKPVISGMYQSQQVTPTMRAMTVRRRTTRIQDWREVNRTDSFAALGMTVGEPLGMTVTSFFVLRA